MWHILARGRASGRRLDMAAAPPTRWQADEYDTFGKPHQAQARAGLQAGYSGAPAPPASDVDTASNAWKHVKAVVMDDGKAEDLYDLLLQSGKQAIDPTPAGWPALLRPRAPMVGKMPAIVMQRYNAQQTVCFCGVFPEIRRAWASVDNSLFLWRYDQWNDVPEEYRNEEQAICAVGLVEPRAGVFTDSVQHLLVVCTATEVVLLGVCCSAGGGSDAWAELALLQLPGYSLSADGVPMCCVAATGTGRIFLGGSDGHLYELLYQATDTWRHKRLAKRDHSAGFASYLPSFLPALWARPSPLLELVADDARHILAARSQASALQVFDLGPEGRDAAVRQVAEMHDFMQSASQAAGGESFRGRSPADRKGAAIIHLAVVPPSESRKLHLVAVTADGRRVYLSTAPAPGYGPPPGAAAQRPQGLRALIARPAPAQPHAPGRAANKALEVSVALCHGGSLLLSEAPQEGRSRLLATSRDMTLPPLGLALSAGRQDGLREAVGQLEMLVPGETCYMRAVPAGGEASWAPPGSVPAAHELAAQTVLPAPRFVLISTAGVLEVERRRPVDVLLQMFEERAGGKLEQFFKTYGPAEVAAMCFLLANAPPPDASTAAVAQARSALENRGLTGVPRMRADVGAENVPPAGGFDMGQALPVAEPEWSGAHQGLCLYLARLLQPVWEQRIVAPGSEEPQRLNFRLSSAALRAAEARLRSLAAVLQEYRQRRQAGAAAVRGFGSAGGGGTELPSKRPRLEEAERLEGQRAGAIAGLVSRAAEAAFLLRTLSEHHMPRLASRLDESSRARLAPLTLRDWVCGREGDAAAAQLISVLVTEHLTASGGIAEDLAAELQAGCPSYFKESDRVFYQASGLMQRAEAAGAAAERDSLAAQALALMMQVPLACDLGQVVPQLASLRNFAGCVALPLRKAAALDPTNAAASDLPERRAARELRLEACYCHVMQLLKFLIQPGSAAEGAAALVQSRLSDAEREGAKRLLLERAAAADDAFFREVLFGTLVDARAARELLSLDCPALEAHLRAGGGLPAAQAVAAAVGPLDAAQVYHLELLARLFRARGAAGDASAVYEILASRRSGVGDQAVSLPQREEAFQEALLQARAQGDSAAIDRLEVRLRITQLQQLAAEALQAKAAALPEGAAEAGELREAAAELLEVPQELALLFNDYAVPHALWELGLEMVALANFDDPGYVRQLWDVFLRQAWEGRQAASGEAGAGFEACCGCVARLGAQLAAGARAFPTPHLALRLELAAAGLWPARAPPAEDSGRAAAALLQACGQREEAVLEAYDSLLRLPGGEGDGAALHSPAVRSRLLGAVAGLLRGLAARAADQRAALANAFRRGAAAREVGRLMEVCESYAAEAGRLQPPALAAGLAAQFADVRKGLQELLLWGA